MTLLSIDNTRTKREHQREKETAMTVIPFPTRSPVNEGLGTLGVGTPLIMIAFPEGSTEDERERTVTVMRSVFKDDLEFLVAHGGTRMFAVPLGGDIGRDGRIIKRPLPTGAQMDDVQALMQDIVLGQAPTH